ncbi:hypothetical protein Tco_0922784 [Tanacetum coccineum]|uniref:Uncharacterized protein n=1 Tax=Tanacetum coccineum TaxID=301880 RepID=A0ABQ5D0B2_9ASTR
MVWWLPNAPLVVAEQNQRILGGVGYGDDGGMTRIMVHGVGEGGDGVVAWDVDVAAKVRQPWWWRRDGVDVVVFASAAGDGGRKLVGARRILRGGRKSVVARVTK